MKDEFNDVENTNDTSVRDVKKMFFILESQFFSE